jgi:exodeoxyribonuclease VII small subunit
MSKKFSYDSAIKELNQIIESIQNDEIGLDQLGEMIKRANELVGKCKTKLREVDAQIENLDQE